MIIWLSGASKSGGGTQGREVKTKSTKKKYKGHDRDDSDDEGAKSSTKGRQQEAEFMSVEEIEERLKKQKELRDCPEDFISEIALKLHRYCYSNNV